MSSRRSTGRSERARPQSTASRISTRSRRRYGPRATTSGSCERRPSTTSGGFCANAMTSRPTDDEEGCPRQWSDDRSAAPGEGCRRPSCRRRVSDPRAHPLTQVPAAGTGLTLGGPVSVCTATRHHDATRAAGRRSGRDLQRRRPGAGRGRGHRQLHSDRELCRLPGPARRRSFDAGRGSGDSGAKCSRHVP